MARFFVAQRDIRDRHAKLGGGELDHLRRVLRLRPGDDLTLFDERGWEHRAVIQAFGSDYAELEITDSSPATKESPLQLTLAVGVTKGEKMDWVVEKATELGVYRIAPYVSTYTVPQLDGRKSEKRAERWRRIALAATKQCGRSRIPEVLPIRPFSAVVEEAAPSEALKVLCWEGEHRQTLRELGGAATGVRSLVLAIGPEGGLRADEAEAARARGFVTVRLGRRILRAETAAIAATALVQHFWGDLDCV